MSGVDSLPKKRKGEKMPMKRGKMKLRAKGKSYPETLYGKNS